MIRVARVATRGIGELHMDMILRITATEVADLTELHPVGDRAARDRAGEVSQVQRTDLDSVHHDLKHSACTTACSARQPAEGQRATGSDMQVDGRADPAGRVEIRRPRCRRHVETGVHGRVTVVDIVVGDVVNPVVVRPLVSERRTDGGLLTGCASGRTHRNSGHAQAKGQSKRQEDTTQNAVPPSFESHYVPLFEGACM